MENPTPRVNFETMGRFIGRKVLLVGEVANLDSGKVVLKTSDNAQVTVMTTGKAPFDSKYVEVLGTVLENQMLQEEDHTNFSDNYDLRLYNELVKLSTGRYSDMFLA